MRGCFSSDPEKDKQEKLIVIISESAPGVFRELI